MSISIRLVQSDRLTVGVRSSLLSPIGHSRWDCRHRSALFESTFLRSLRSISVTRLHRYYGRSDSCCPALRDLVHELRLFPQQVSLINASVLPDHSVSKHLMHRCCRFITLPFSSTAFLCGSRLRLWLAGSSIHPAVSSLSSYGLVVHLLLLSTTHRCVAVAFGYRPESVCLKRTFTSPSTCAFRRASQRFPRIPKSLYRLSQLVNRSALQGQGRQMDLSEYCGQ
jgi:hypothetical protein